MVAVAAGGEVAKPTRLERLVPADAVAVVQVVDLPGLRAAFEGSALAKAIKSSRLLGYLQTLAGAATDFGAALLTGMQAGELGALLGDSVALVVLDLAGPAAAPQRVPVAFVIELAEPKKFEEALDSHLRLLSALVGELTLSEHKRAGTTVRELALPKGATLAYCFRDKALIAGSRHAVHSILDGLAAKRPSIATDETYQAVKRQLPPEAGLSAYVNLGALIEKSGMGAKAGQLQEFRAVGLSQAKAAGLTIDFHKGQVRERFFLYTGGANTGLLRALTEGRPLSPSMHRFAPRDYTALVTIALQDVGLWQRLRTVVADAKGEGAASFLDAASTKIEEAFGIQVKEGLFETMTGEAFLAFDLRKLPEFHGTGREAAPQDVPHVFGARLRDATALLNTLDRIAANERLWEQGVERTAAKHAGTDLFTFRLPANVDARPTYAIVDGVVLFSFRPEFVRAAIDAYKSKKSLGPAAIPRPCHCCIQLNDGQLLATLLRLIRDELPGPAQRLLPELDRILGGLHGYSATLRREPQGFSLVALSDLGTVVNVLLTGGITDHFNTIVARRVQGDFDKITVALEKYHAKHNAYPDSLDQLVPDFLPVLTRDRFQPKRPYGYTRAQPGPDGKLPDAWILTSVGPDGRPDIPVDQFDPVDWPARLKTQDPDEISRLKGVIYQFRKDQYPDERKVKDEGDLVRMGGRGILPGRARPKAPKTPRAPPALKPPKPPKTAPAPPKP